MKCGSTPTTARSTRPAVPLSRQWLADKGEGRRTGTTATPQRFAARPKEPESGAERRPARTFCLCYFCLQPLPVAQPPSEGKGERARDNENKGRNRDPKSRCSFALFFAATPLPASVAALILMAQNSHYETTCPGWRTDMAHACRRLSARLETQRPRFRAKKEKPRSASPRLLAPLAGGAAHFPAWTRTACIQTT